MSCVCSQNFFWLEVLARVGISSLYCQCLRFIIKAKPFFVEISFKALFVLSSFYTFLGGREVEVPDQSHKVGEEHPVLHGHEVDVDNLRNCPDFPVGEQRVQKLLTGIKKGKVIT